MERFFQSLYSQKFSKKNHETQQTESDPDELLQRDQMEKDKKEKAQISQEAVTKFLERQRIKCLEAQKKAKERIIEHKNREKLEREQLARKREKINSPQHTE